MSMGALRDRGRGGDKGLGEIDVGKTREVQTIVSKARWGAGILEGTEGIKCYEDWKALLTSQAWSILYAVWY